jgi:hypothetical protein
MSKKLVIILTVFILVTSFSGCGKYEAPISSKTYDIKSFRIEDGKKISIDPIFSKTVFEYENAPEKIIDFVEWKPKPLTAKGELEQFWVEDIEHYHKANSDEWYRWPECTPTPQGWMVSDKGITYCLDTNSLEKKRCNKYPEYWDSGSNYCFGNHSEAYESDNWACWDNESGEILWIRPRVWAILESTSNKLFLSREDEYFITQIEPNDGRRLWGLKYYTKIDSNFDISKPFSSKDYIWTIFKKNYNSNIDQIIGYNFSLNELIRLNLSDIIGTFIYENSLCLIDKKLVIYKFNETTLKIELLWNPETDLYRYISGYNNIDCFVVSDMLYLDNDYHLNILMNLKTRKIFKPYDVNIEMFDNTIFASNNGNLWGIDPETFELTWHLDTIIFGEDFSKDRLYDRLLLVDDRGLIIKDDKKLYGFRPKK